MTRTQLDYEFRWTQFTIIFPRKNQNISIWNCPWTDKSKDGCIKLWDGVSHRCYSTLERAHDGYEVCSVQFTKNGKFLLTSGKDSICRLWEISTSRVIHQFTGAELSGRQMHRSNACFNHTEEHVMFPCKFMNLVQPLSDPDQSQSVDDSNPTWLWIQARKMFHYVHGILEQPNVANCWHLAIIQSLVWLVIRLRNLHSYLVLTIFELDFGSSNRPNPKLPKNTFWTFLAIKTIMVLGKLYLG